MPKTTKYTSQGVRDLNDLGGKRVNGKRPGCAHFPQDVYVYDQINRIDAVGPYPVAVLACSACGKILGPEDQFEVTVR
jgi:hypothetical protein